MRRSARDRTSSMPAAAARPRVRALRPSRHVRTVTPFVRRVLPTAWPISPIPSRPTFTAEVSASRGAEPPTSCHIFLTSLSKSRERMQRMLQALRTRLLAWRYEATGEGREPRDLRVDLLRGFCVVVMIIDHVGGEQSWLYVFTGGNRWIVSAAEGFVLLSGFTMGMVHNRTINVKGVRAMFEKVFGRAWLLYALTVVLTIAFAAVSTALGAPYVEELTPAHGRLDFAVSVLTFHRTYSLTDILVLYTLLVLMAGPAPRLLARGDSRLPVAAARAARGGGQVLAHARAPGRGVRA